MSNNNEGTKKLLKVIFGIPVAKTFFVLNLNKLIGILIEFY